ncbi:hypothetical protein D3C86_2182180 [compost metagenome]
MAPAAALVCPMALAMRALMAQAVATASSSAISRPRPDSSAMRRALPSMRSSPAVITTHQLDMREEASTA